MSMADVLTDTFWQPADLTAVLRSCGVSLPAPAPAQVCRDDEEVDMQVCCVWVCVSVSVGVSVGICVC